MPFICKCQQINSKTFKTQLYFDSYKSYIYIYIYIYKHFLYLTFIFLLSFSFGLQKNGQKTKLLCTCHH